MAAHHYRALLMELGSITNPEGDLQRQAELLEFAIGHAPAFAYLPWETYDRIREWCDRVSMSKVANWDQPKHKLRDEFWNIMMEHLPAIGKKWLNLDKPQCAEDWGRLKYGDLEGKPMTQERYISHRGNKCPFCESEEIEMGKLQSDDNYTWAESKCITCASAWTELYTLDGYRPGV